MQFQERMRGHDQPEPARLSGPINAHARAHAVRCGRRVCHPGCTQQPWRRPLRVEAHCWFSPPVFALSRVLLRGAHSRHLRRSVPVGATHKAGASHISRLIVSICRSSPLDDSYHWGENGDRTLAASRRDHGGWHCDQTTEMRYNRYDLLNPFIAGRYHPSNKFIWIDYFKRKLV